MLGNPKTGGVSRLAAPFQFVCLAIFSVSCPSIFSAPAFDRVLSSPQLNFDDALAQHEERAARSAPARPFEEMSFAELKAHFSETHGGFSSRERRGWETVKRLAQSTNSGAAARNIAELLHAITNNHLRPAPTSIHILTPPILFWDHLHNPIGHGDQPASNLVTNSNETDLSRLDPGASTFWRRPAAIAAQDLFAGFGRSELLRYETKVWEYAEPKTSWGGNPGFDARSGDLEIKIKFAEMHSEPFTARVFHALGYYAEPTDYAPFLRIKYSRRLFREFHLRKDLTIGIRALGIRLHTINLQKRYDPFTFIDEAVLKDGRRLPGRELKAFLLRDARGKAPENDPANFIPEREAQVDCLVTTAANVQLKAGPCKPIGPWSFDALGHEHLRELRGAGLLAAWVGWYDSRFENMRLKVCTADDHPTLAHYFNDLGGGLGKALGVISRPMERPDLFPWTFTRPYKFQGKGRMTIPFRIRHFQPLVDTAAFKEMTIDDARWMARLIAQLTGEQIEQALRASGFSAADIATYTAKLIHRRDRMISDLGLAGEIAPLRRSDRIMPLD